MKWNTLLYSLLFSGLGIFSYLLLANHTNLSDSVAALVHTPQAFVFVLVAFNILGFTTLQMSVWINSQYSHRMNRTWKIIAIYLLVVVLFLLLNYGLLVTAKLLGGAPHPFLFLGGGWRILLVVWLVELVILGLILANRSIRNALHLQRKTAKLQAENDRARYTALQNQLNPHFLFNSLNTLIAEIEYNPKNAIRFTRNLSDVYRYVLQCQERTLVTLAEEMTFARSYLFLHQVRLGNCISLQAGLSAECLDYQLPPLTLQLLVENVIKHNSITASKPMPIHIFLEDTSLVVTNPIQPKKNSDTSGVGLNNLSNRCRLMSGRDISLSRQNETFTVKVPLLYE